MLQIPSIIVAPKPWSSDLLESAPAPRRKFVMMNTDKTESSLSRYAPFFENLSLRMNGNKKNDETLVIIPEVDESSSSSESGDNCMSSSEILEKRVQNLNYESSGSSKIEQTAESSQAINNESSDDAPGISDSDSSMGQNDNLHPVEHHPIEGNLSFADSDKICALCCKEFSNTYFLRAHLINKHDVYDPDYLKLDLSQEITS